MKLLVIADDETAVRRLPDTKADVLVSCGDLPDDIRVGLAAFLRYIERAKPTLFLHGHQPIHRETQIGPTRVVGTFGYRLVVYPEF